MTVDQYKVTQGHQIADARQALRHVFVRNLVLPANIGVHGHEKGRTQRVRVNLDLGVREGGGRSPDELSQVVCYEEITQSVRGIVARGHVNLVETLAEDIAAMCLEDPRVRCARVRVEKLDVLAEAESVGVEIERLSGHV